LAAHVAQLAIRWARRARSLSISPVRVRLPEAWRRPSIRSTVSDRCVTAPAWRTAPPLKRTKSDCSALKLAV
jgi:hypothetical protein